MGGEWIKAVSLLLFGDSSYSQSSFIRCLLKILLKLLLEIIHATQGKLILNSPLQPTQSMSVPVELVWVFEC